MVKQSILCSVMGDTLNTERALLLWIQQVLQSASNPRVALDFKHPMLNIQVWSWSAQKNRFLNSQEIETSEAPFLRVLESGKPFVLSAAPPALQGLSYIEANAEPLFWIPLPNSHAHEILLIQWLDKNNTPPVISFFENLLSLLIQPNLLRTDLEKLQARLQQSELNLQQQLSHPVSTPKTVKLGPKGFTSTASMDRLGKTSEDLSADSWIGLSPALNTILEMSDRVAPTHATVLIQGESGTGKERLARRIHAHSANPKGPFVSLNCAALQESLLESELFGHERGAFTGAFQQKLGLCEIANEGTLFLDEIGELQLGMQTKLLRFLQEGEFYRVGGKKPIHVHVRILSATNRDLSQEVTQGRFREDLFYRLNTITLRMPPLRERREDIENLCRHFMALPLTGGGTSIVQSLSPQVIEAFHQYHWPGNVRELRNTLERIRILGNYPEARLEDVPVSIRHPKDLNVLPGLTVGISLEDLEKSHILKTLEVHYGNKTRAANALGITIKTLYNKLHRYGVL